jgi:predicted Rdx family selenoprotein
MHSHNTIIVEYYSSCCQLITSIYMSIYILSWTIRYQAIKAVHVQWSNGGLTRLFPEQVVNVKRTRRSGIYDVQTMLLDDL